MNEDQIRAELEAVKAALHEPTADIADLEARVERVASSLVVRLARPWKPRTPLQEHDLRELVALWAEIKAALEVRGGG